MARKKNQYDYDEFDDENIDTKRKYPYIKGQIYQQEAEEDRLAAG